MIVLPCVLFGNFELQAATATNAYVTVSCSTYGVEDVVPVGADFYITTRNVSKPSFRADISVKANSPYYLVKPGGGRMNLGIGESDEYRVRDESGNEDEFSGHVYVLKLDIEPAETNVCWKSTSCTLKLTDDSYPGGTAEWTSSPAGISGRGNSITFNPNALSAGVYTVTARSGAVVSYTDTCTVRVVKIVTETMSKTPVNRSRTKIGIGEEVVCKLLPEIPVNWVVEGAGSVSPSMGVRTLFSANDSPGNAKVHAQLLGLECDVEFKIVAPQSLVVLAEQDKSLGFVQGTRFMAASSEFTVEVQPVDVSFYNVEFRENIPGESFVWPSGASARISAKTLEWNVNEGNVSVDSVSSGLVPYSRLIKDGVYCNFSYTVRVPEEYKNEDDQWTVWFQSEIHPREFKSNGMARVGLSADNVLWGSFMGPWDWRP